MLRGKYAKRQDGQGMVHLAPGHGTAISLQEEKKIEKKIEIQDEAAKKADQKKLFSEWAKLGTKRGPIKE